MCGVYTIIYIISKYRLCRSFSEQNVPPIVFNISFYIKNVAIIRLCCVAKYYIIMWIWSTLINKNLYLVKLNILLKIIDF